jgi:hypothetical protein
LSKKKNSHIERESAKGVHEHDGFMFRFIYGAGLGDLSVDNYNNSDLTLEGAAGMGRLQLGYSFIGNINLFIDNAAMVYTDPKVIWNAEEQDNAVSEYVSSQLGIGLSYYIMPVNVYIALSACVVVSEFKGDLIDTQDVSGTGYFAAIGKEWWVSDNWGLGISLYYYQEKLEIDDSALSEKYNVIQRSWGIAFTATYN